MMRRALFGAAVVTLMCFTRLSFAQNDSAALVALQPDALLQGRMRDVADWAPILDRLVLSPLELQGRLAGIDAPADVSVANLRAWFDESAKREAEFDSQGASELRERIMATYERLPVPTPEAATVVALSLHDAAAAALGEGKSGVALKLAKEALRRFASVPLDVNRHPPQVVQLFTRATVELRKTATSQLTVRTSAPGRVILDGVSLGNAANTLTSRVLTGDYVVWVEGDGMRSLAHKLTVRGPDDAITIDLSFEGALTWSPVPTLQCASSCESALLRLARRASASAGIGLELSGAGQARALMVEAASGASSSKDVPELSTIVPLDLQLATPKEPPAFSPLLLFPLGVGQFHQKRYAFGAGFAAAEVGFIAWHIIAINRYNDTPVGDSDAASGRQHAVNLSAGLLIGAAVIGVGEAVVHHLLTRSDEPGQ